MKNLVWGVLLTASAAWAQPDYKSETITPGLKENAHSVIRHHETVFTVKNSGEAVQRVYSVITILDEEGDDQAAMTVGYDKLSKVITFEGALYDANGKLIKKLRKNDVEDYSSFSDYNLFDDQRFKSANFPKQPAYPYTVEFLIETSERNLMFYPVWKPQHKEHMAVERALYVVNLPANTSLRYKEMNMPSVAVMTTQPTGGKTYTWTLTNLPALEFEPLSPPVLEQIPIVYTAPVDFEVQGYKGKIVNWSDLGRFYSTLNADRDHIPDALRQQITELANSEKTASGKVRKIYKYLQDQTRYVSIQLGIGGWQTIEAEKVAINKYGDCKALTNYTQALLKAVGITSYPMLVMAGDKAPDLLADFPSFQFNHIMLCVPDKQDTLFLECTSEHGPAGYMSDFTSNRHALLILPDGGKLIKTPVYKPTDNQQKRLINVMVTENGDASATVRTRYTGLQQDDYAQIIHNKNYEDQRSWLIKHIHIPAFELGRFAYDEQPASIPTVTEQLDLQVRRWATMSGTRLFLPLNLMSSLSAAPVLTQPRKSPLVLGANYDFDDSDTITYQLPKGYKPEFQIPPVAIESKFGSYKAQVTVEGDRTVYIRHVVMHQGKYPPSAYSDWIDFRKKIAKADRAQLVFVKTN